MTSGTSSWPSSLFHPQASGKPLLSISLGLCQLLSKSIISFPWSLSLRYPPLLPAPSTAFPFSLLCSGHTTLPTSHAQILHPLYPAPAYTVKVTLLVSGAGHEVAGIHTGLNGWGSLLQIATELLALCHLWAFF
jgi:hypothetical protein